MLKSVQGLLTATVLGAVFGGTGCAPGNQELRTNRIALNHPEFWQVKNVAKVDGEATYLRIGSYGTAVIDDGTGAIEGKGTNYESVQAEVEARIYAWPAPASNDDALTAVGRLLGPDKDLQLSRHSLVSEQPPECGLFKKKYKIFGVQQSVIDLVSRPGWRTIIIAGQADGVLLAVITRVEFEQDANRFCHNLSNMQTQLQNLLDGLRVQNGAVLPGAKS